MEAQALAQYRSLSRQARDVAGHYDDGDWYLSGWHPRHLHFGLFEPGEWPVRPERGEAEWLDRDLLDKAVERMIDEIVAPVWIGAGELIVDAACGVGGTALHLAGALGCRVVGLNISERQLEIALSLAKSDGLEHLVEFRFSDCSEEIRLPDGSADVVVSIDGACHMADRGRFLKECARILRPGGRLVGSDWMAAAALTPEEYRKHVHPICESWSMVGLERPAGYLDKLEAAGLGTVGIVDLSMRCLPNARILAVQEQRMREAARSGTLPADGAVWMERFRLLTRAWFAGAFTLQRYFARKPGMAGGHAG